MRHSRRHTHRGSELVAMMRVRAVAVRSSSTVAELRARVPKMRRASRSLRELEVAPTAEHAPRAASAVAALHDWSSMAQGAFAANTVRAWRADWEIFTAFCGRVGAQSMPSAGQTVRDFVFDCLENQKKPATVRRYVSTIGRAHRAAGVGDPSATETVKLALKEMGRLVPKRQAQARGLVWSEIAQFLEFDVRNLRDIRDRALVAVAYDTMCRREELVNLRIEDIEEAADESGSVLIRRSKTDTAGEGATAYLSALTMRLVSAWLESSRRKSGTLFARVFGKQEVGDGLTAQNVTAVLRKVGQWIGLDRKEWERISGHSARVGAAQDLLALNIDLASVMQAGRWKDTRMPMRYGEKILATRGGMARAAKHQGRA
jgi:integrase